MATCWTSRRKGSSASVLSEGARSARRRVAAASLFGFALAAACGGDEAGGEESAAGATSVAGTSAGSSAAGASGAGTAARGGTTSGTAGGTTGGQGGSAGASTGGDASGPDGSAGSLAGAAARGGSSGADAGTEPPDGVPEPTDAGLSVYSTECRGETVSCESAAVHCLGVFLNEGGVGYTCSNLCRTADDCSDAPSGAEATAGCVTFTNASRCVLVCYENGAEYSCPTGMGCYRYPDFPVGYCLWL
jgi:hypothetical protein